MLLSLRIHAVLGIFLASGAMATQYASADIPITIDRSESVRSQEELVVLLTNHSNFLIDYDGPVYDELDIANEFTAAVREAAKFPALLPLLQSIAVKANGVYESIRGTNQLVRSYRLVYMVKKPIVDELNKD